MSIYVWAVAGAPESAGPVQSGLRMWIRKPEWISHAVSAVPPV